MLDIYLLKKILNKYLIKKFEQNVNKIILNKYL